MARIAFFNERLPPDPDPVSGFSFELIRGLADQQNDIRVFSTYRADADLPPPHPRIEILRPFKNWSWWEVPRVIPLLMEFRPDILHVVEPRAEALHGLTNAMSTFPALTPMLNRPALVTSFYDLRADQLKKHRLLLHASDAVTVSNEPQLKLLKDFFSRLPQKPELTLLPLPASFSHEQDKETLSSPLKNTLQEISKNNNYDLIFVPGDIEIHRAPEVLFQSLNAVLMKHLNVVFVFGGSWDGVPHRNRHNLMRIFKNSGDRVLFTGRLSEAEERQCLTLSKFVFLASLPLESLWLARLLRSAADVSTIPILNSDQVKLDSLSWLHGENAWITTTNPHDWSSSISNALDSIMLVEQMRARLPEFTRREAIDQPSNVINRLYARKLGTRVQFTPQ